MFLEDLLFKIEGEGLKLVSFYLGKDCVFQIEVVLDLGARLISNLVFRGLQLIHEDCILGKEIKTGGTANPRSLHNHLFTILSVNFVGANSRGSDGLGSLSATLALSVLLQLLLHLLFLLLKSSLLSLFSSPLLSRIFICLLLIPLAFLLLMRFFILLLFIL